MVAPVRTLQDEFRERFRTLTTRLRESTEARLIEKSSEGLYGLTRRGRALLELLNPLDEWAKGWSRELARHARSKK